jgi:hypothetical protein
VTVFFGDKKKLVSSVNHNLDIIFVLFGELRYMCHDAWWNDCGAHKS